MRQHADLLQAHGLARKYILKKLMEGKLPHEIIYRKKKGFGTPIGAWLKGPLAPWMRDVLAPAEIEKTGGCKERRRGSGKKKLTKLTYCRTDTLSTTYLIRHSNKLNYYEGILFVMRICPLSLRHEPHKTNSLFATLGCRVLGRVISSSSQWVVTCFL